ncbi:MAG: type II toxin-antitoxin system VapC family toxin [Desulfobacula sp.]|nr:type II toxin-antitoxin system VapC family toxin [Desulfobacula sp.]
MIVDTDIIIWYMRDHPMAVKLLDSSKGFLISVITYMELVQGMKNKGELKALKIALQLWKVKILQIDETISIKAMFYVEQYFLSHSMQWADALIASTAILRQLPLHTGNAKHFALFKDIDLHPFQS